MFGSRFVAIVTTESFPGFPVNLWLMGMMVESVVFPR